jgi:hypothetical protein
MAEQPNGHRFDAGGDVKPPDRGCPVVSSSWRSPRRHCPVQRIPSYSGIWGTSISALHARRWSPCVQTSFRISRNDIGRSAWTQTQRMIAGSRECTIYCRWLIWGRCPAEAVASSTGLTISSALRCLRMRSYCADYENRNGRLWSVCHVGQALRPLVE